MDRRMLTMLYCAIMAAGLGIASFAVRPQPPDGLAKITMLDVGQGDSFLIRAENGRTILIDGGLDEKVLLELSKVMQPGDRTIDVIVATHPDSDHIGGLPLVLGRYRASLFLTTQALSSSEVFKELMKTLDEEHIPAYYARRGMTVQLDPRAAFTVLFPDRDTTGWETNTASVVGRLQIGNRSALFTGDSPAHVEAFLAAAIPAEIDVDILKLGHHGSKTASTDTFLKATSPALALISAGINNKYGHPAPETMDRLKKLGIGSVSTQDAGAYTVETDGEVWREQKGDK